MEFWLWMSQLFACTRARIKTQINRGLSPIVLKKVGVLLNRGAIHCHLLSYCLSRIQMSHQIHAVVQDANHLDRFRFLVGTKNNEMLSLSSFTRHMQAKDIRPQLWPRSATHRPGSVSQLLQCAAQRCFINPRLAFAKPFGCPVQNTEEISLGTLRQPHTPRALHAALIARSAILAKYASSDAASLNSV